MTENWEQKCWGLTRCVHKGHKYSRHELEVVKGGFCSFHYHQYRSNVFRVEAGVVRVVWAFGWEIKHKDLHPGNVLEIKEGIPHQFQVLENGLMIEEYHSLERCDMRDIYRLTEGGNEFCFGPSFDVVGIILSDGKVWQGNIE